MSGVAPIALVPEALPEVTEVVPVVDERAKARERQRADLLQETAVRVARDWASACGVELRREGRRMEGGWPGTVPEARMRASAEVGRLLRGKHWPALTHQELGELASLTHGEARRSWRSLCDGDG